MPDKSARPCIMFMYLGRQGALGRFTLELAEAAAEAPFVDAHFLISSSNDLAASFARFGPNIYSLDTFARPTPMAVAGGFLKARRVLGAVLDRVRPTAVINLMPHVWSPLLAGCIARRGIRFIPVIHDAVPHPGDPTARLTPWLLRDVRQAAQIVTLSDAVADTLALRGCAERQRIRTLFHPDLAFGRANSLPRKRSGGPLRLLFFGRIMGYKGLDLLVDAVESVRAQGGRVDLGVAGSGAIAALTARRLERLNAEVINRWIADDEIGGILARYDAIACPHVEASQSGVVAVAFGASMPVVAMPAGGIAEQVQDGRTGVLADQITAPALADAISRLVSDVALYERISGHLSQTASTRSMSTFLRAIVQVVCKKTPNAAAE